MIWQVWWIWVVAGIGLALLEVFLPGFLFLGFALGAAATGIYIWLVPGGSLAGLLLLFAVLSVVSWVVMRALFGVRRGQRKVITRDINED